MDLSTVVWTVVLSVLPIFELRGAMPYALLNRMPLAAAFALCVAANALVSPFMYLFLSTVHTALSRWGWYRSVFDRLIGRARKKVKPVIDKYGYWGLAIFVGIPLPMTGAYTGTLGAWVLGMEPRKAFVAVTAGVLMAGVIVATVSVLGIKALSIFVAPPA